MAFYIEVSNNIHGNGPEEWDVGRCLWSPTRNRGGGDTWGLMRDLREGDIVFHSIKIDGDNHRLYGKSVVASSVQERADGPNETGSEWESDMYYYVPLRDHIVFDEKPYTKDFLNANRNSLTRIAGSFFDRNFNVAQKYLSRLTENEAVLIDQYINNRGVDMPNRVNIKEKLDYEFSQGIKQVILTGAPGTGKTYISKEYAMEKTNNDAERVSFVQFHPSYDYVDFVEGIRPIEEDGEIKFVKKDGIFKEFSRKAAADLNNDYYFIIDEINRADLSKVFGELMFGLEESYRGEENAFKTQYHGLKTHGIEEDLFENGFYIPENLYIIGTMNDIDRSVESFDFAIRRRFRWLKIEANEVLAVILEDMWGDELLPGLIERIIALNNVISGEKGTALGLNSNYHIGPAYFVKVEDLSLQDYLNNVWRSRIEPLLQEYIRGRKNNQILIFLEECKTSFLSHD